MNFIVFQCCFLLLLLRKITSYYYLLTENICQSSNRFNFLNWSFFEMQFFFVLFVLDEWNFYNNIYVVRLYKSISNIFHQEDTVLLIVEWKKKKSSKEKKTFSGKNMERKNVEKYTFVIYFVVEWQRIEEVVYFKLKEQTYSKCEYNSINYNFRLNDYFAEIYHITKYECIRHYQFPLILHNCYGLSLWRRFICFVIYFSMNMKWLLTESESIILDSSRKWHQYNPIKTMENTSLFGWILIDYFEIQFTK